MFHPFGIHPEPLWQKLASTSGQVAVLIDPEKTKTREELKPLIEKAEFAGVSFLLVGGSTASRLEVETCVELIRNLTRIPVLLFPGGSHQLSAKADGLLYLSLVSGRNPDFLITHHVNSAREVFELGIEIIPTAYILVDGGTHSSVAYVSQTTPIPREQHNIAVNTALAALMQGKRLVYFDAGSGAKHTVPPEFVTELRKFSDIPIIIGGGIRSREDLEQYRSCGANLLVVGNKLEEEVDFLLDMREFIRQAK